MFKLQIYLFATVNHFCFILYIQINLFGVFKVVSKRGTGFLDLLTFQLLAKSRFAFPLQISITYTSDEMLSINYDTIAYYKLDVVGKTTVCRVIININVILVIPENITISICLYRFRKYLKFFFLFDSYNYFLKAGV